MNERYLARHSGERSISETRWHHIANETEKGIVRSSSLTCSIISAL
jgi:hypothetical protein